MKQHKFNGISIYESGEANPQTIIFIHAFPMCNRMWDKQVESLEKKYRVITYDLRGFGYSEVGDAQFTIETHVDDLMMIIDEMKISSPIICGLSMGGYIAIRALERYQNKFKAVILSDTSSLADSNIAKINRAYQIKQLDNGESENFFDNFLKKAVCEKTLKTNKELIKFINEMMRWQTMKGIKAGLLALGCRTDTTEFLAKINIPALIIVGEEDRLTPPEFAETLNKNISDSILAKIPDSGHFPNMENPQVFNECIGKFLESIS